MGLPVDRFDDSGRSSAIDLQSRQQGNGHSVQHVVGNLADVVDECLPRSVMGSNVRKATVLANLQTAERRYRVVSFLPHSLHSLCT